MSKQYSFAEGIDLFVKDRISKQDAERQTKTATSILQSLIDNPGLILADEVGMGKTFVSLAVAVSIALQDAEKRPVVVMVPPSLKEKWPRDFVLFKEKCLTTELAKVIDYAIAERGVAFLKLLDDPPEKRKSIIFLTHGAMSRSLADGWVKLALIQRSLYRRKNIDGLKRALCRSMGGLLQMRYIEDNHPGLFDDLINNRTQNWLGVMKKHQFIPDNGDEPVPEAARTALVNINPDAVYEALQNIPLRKSVYYEQRLTEARRAINGVMKEVWRECLKRTNIQLPLLILDEAHHLKNAQTQLASLFQTEDSKSDMDEISKGPLGGVFERMVFLTATPFQLGHHELCSVLERFKGISWLNKNAPSMKKEMFDETLKNLHDALNAAQETGIRLDDTWGKLQQEHVLINGTYSSDIERWWSFAQLHSNNPQEVDEALIRFKLAKEKLKVAEDLLKPWVIRHQRKKLLNEKGIFRRQKKPGAAILDNTNESHNELNDAGIPLSGESLLPFLLAARATAFKPKDRPVFAEGLASCYEAFLFTRQRELQGSMHEPLMDQDDEPLFNTSSASEASDWYLDKLEECIQQDNFRLSASHPKMEATVSRALALWEAGEKVLVFCHYISTGRVLRQHISNAIEERIFAIAANKMNCSIAEAQQKLIELGDKFFDDSRLRKACDYEVGKIFDGYPGLEDYREKLIDVVRRFLRTPSFLVRYFPLSESGVIDSTIVEAFDAQDGSGLTINELIVDFFDFLQNRCGVMERKNYIEAVDRIQTGTHHADDAKQSFGDDEGQGARSDTLVPNVRLVNGASRQETRQRLMLAFNTPFYPEILIASSVLAEGVDLHLYCRYVIHHDLSWNPSTLEQRTGRIDRIGAKVERCGAPIYIYLPYVAETQDEKMYRVVMDRERWFNIVMGGKYTVDFSTTEKLSKRIPFPESAAEELKFKLGVSE